MHVTTSRIVRPIAVVATAALGLGSALSVVGASSASAAPPIPSVSRIAPISVPAGTSIAMVVHGHHLDTTIGATTVAFGGVPAVSVDCVSPSLCKVVTPDLGVGTVSVVVSTDGAPLNPETLTVVPYAAPVVRLFTNARGNPSFSVHALADGYPATGATGFDAVTIQNTTATSQTVTNTVVGDVTLAAGASTTYSLQADLGPYIFFTSGTPTSALTVKTK
jgi:hypothetical protein